MDDPYVIALINRQGKDVNPNPEPFQPGFLAEYIPGAYQQPSLVDITQNPDEALHFETFAAAIECVRQAVGLRPDGKANRPLTAYTTLVTRLSRLDAAMRAML